MRYFFLPLLGMLFALQPAVVPVVHAQTMYSSQVGNFLLQVEDAGKLWYVKPATQKRIYLANPQKLFEEMQKGRGISNANLQKIPIGMLAESIIDSDNDGLSDQFELALNTNKNSFDTDGDGISDGVEVQNQSDPNKTGTFTLDSVLMKKLSGSIVLQVEDRGQAWYIFPETNRRYYLGTPQEAFHVVAQLSKGISNQNIQQIPTK